VNVRRSGLTVAGCMAVVALLAQPACAGQQGDSRSDPYAAYAAGDYDAAIRGLRALVRANPAEARPRRTLVAALAEVGRYDEAEAAAKETDSAELANSLGEVLVRVGRLDEAVVAFRRAVAGRAADRNTARLNLAMLDDRRGNTEAALDSFDTFIDLYNGSTRLDARDLIAVAEAVRRLGVRDPQLFKDAVKALDEAIKEDNVTIDGSPAGYDARVQMGNLFLEKFNSTEAQPLFREVLEKNEHHPGALLGMAVAKNFDGSAESMELVEQSLKVNPNDVAALVFRARLLLDLERPADARKDIDTALSIDAHSLDALSARATMEFLAGDDAAFAASRREILAINPVYADLYNQVAELAVRQRRYAGSVELAAQAVALDPRSWTGYGILGLNELRLGEVAKARTDLEKSFAGDPYNPWIKNTLDLLDTFGQYRIVKTARFELMLYGSEADLLSQWIGPLAEEAFDSLSRRYHYTPKTPVRVEVYPRHADFSVRTVGIAGLGALGVCFGNVLAIDSPAARERGDFNWGSTLWHELTHTMTLGLSNHRVPRWFTEGLSVLEERRARPGWGDDLTPDFIAAWKKGDILPFSRLNEGFVRPKYPQMVIFSYYEASLVSQMIEERHGFDAILSMLKAYGEGKSDETVIQDVLGMKPAAFDKQFEEWVRTRFAKQIDAVVVQDEGLIGRALGAVRGGGDRAAGFAGDLQRGAELVKAGNDDEARTVLQRARDQFPEYVGSGNAYVQLAGVEERAGNLAAAVSDLEALAAINENDYDANLAIAGLRERMNDPRGAAVALERAIYISPYDKALHEKLAALHAQAGDLQGVVRARRALVALDPVDKADARYQLALALFEAGDTAGARREVLNALEIAPNFERAQELLLRIRSGRSDEAGADRTMQETGS
jgi:tetratricopeptide (TPR) repeat protein